MLRLLNAFTFFGFDFLLKSQKLKNSVRHLGHVYLTHLCFTAFTFLENFYVNQTILSAITFVGLCTCNRYDFFYLIQ